jgi:hypothetical protein
MKKSLAGPNALSRIRVFLLAIWIIAVTPRLSGDIILLSRLSDADAYADNLHGVPFDPPPQSQTGFLPANLSNLAIRAGGFIFGTAIAKSTSNSSILINNPTRGLRVVGDGTAAVEGGGIARASAKIIFLSFRLTEVPYPYSITGQLNGAMATARLNGETGTIFEKVGFPLSESGTLPPGNYTLSVEVNASTWVGGSHSDANFAFALEGPVSTPAPTPIPVTRATNLSTRLLVGTGNDVGIGGFIIADSGPRYLLLRGIGPSLANFGIPNPLADPTLELHGPAGFTTMTSNNWRDTQEDPIIATGRAPSNDLESAIVAELAPGAYTAILAGNAGTTGVGLVEIWDLLPNQGSRLANISSRGNVGTGNDIMIAGFILEGGSGEDSVIVRGLGPSLSGTVNGALGDPKLELRNPQGALIASDDNWMDDPNQAAIIQATGLAPSNNLESAIAATLMPGPYTALLSGVNNGTGVGLVEVYERGAPAH